MLRLLLGLLPMFAMSAFTTDAGDDDDADDDDGQPGDATGDNGGNSGTNIDAIVQEKLNAILGNEKKKLRDSVREEVKAELEAEHERKQQEEAQQFQPLYESEKDKRERLEREREADNARWRQRLVHRDVLLEAQRLNFVDPEDAWKWIDLEAIAYSDEGEPTNIPVLVEQIATKKSHLIKSESDRRSVTYERSNGPGAGEQKASEGLIASRYGRFREKAQT